LFDTGFQCLQDDWQAKAGRGIYILTPTIESSPSTISHPTHSNSASNIFFENLSCSLPSNLQKLWHYRLCHPSGPIISALFPFDNCNRDHVSDICHIAKQRNLSLYLSSSFINVVYELFMLIVGDPTSTRD